MNKSNKKQAITTPDLIVLSLLLERPMHGYELTMELERRDVQDWAEISRPQVYYSLKKLQSIKMIKEKSNNSPAEGPARQVFQVNERGKNALLLALDDTQWATQRPPQPFLTWMALSSDASHHVIKKLLKERYQFLEIELKREKMTYEYFKNKDEKKVAAGLLMIDLTIRQFEVELQWLKKAEATLIKGRR